MFLSNCPLFSLFLCKQVQNIDYYTITLADLGGVPGARPPPPMGPNSFIFAYIFTKKCPRRRFTRPPNGCTPPLWEILDPPLLLHDLTVRPVDTMCTE